MTDKKKRHGHFCWICKRYRPNERFSGRGHRTHVCRSCSLLPRDEVQRIESLNQVWDFLFCQSRISKKNLAVLGELSQAEDIKVKRLASAALELARLRPYKKKRFRGLRQAKPELWERLKEVGIIFDDLLSPEGDCN